MRNEPARLAVAALLCVATMALAPRITCGATPLSAVRSAAVELDAWLNGSPHAPGWRKLLKYETLTAELARGDQANPGVVADVLARFQSGKPGLDLPAFAKARRALAAWHAELAASHPPSPAELPDFARAAIATVEPPKPDDVRRARATLLASVEQLDRFLRGGGPRGEGWKRILGWSVLDEQIRRDATADLVQLEGVAQRFSADKPGLELEQFGAVRRSLRRYIDMASFAANPKSKEQSVAQLEALTTELATYAQKPTGDLARLIGTRVGYLSRTGQATPVVDAVRRHYCQPNLVVQASRTMVAAGVEQPVDDTGPVEEVILGTDIHGTGHTVGTLRLRLSPNADRASLTTIMEGKTHSDTIGYNGPVRIFSTGVTTLRAEKRIVIDADGLTSLPASSTASTDTTIHDIQANRCGRIGALIERIAWKRAAKQQAEAEAIGSRRAEVRLNHRVDDQADETLEKANREFANRFRHPLVRRDEFPQLFQLATTDQYLRLTALQANQDQLAAPDAPPALDGEHVLSVRMHESLVGNFANAVLGGETITEESLMAKAKELTGEVPEKLKSKQDEDPWSITFARRDPVTVALVDNGFQVTIRGRRFTSGERTFQAMNVTASYKIAKTDTGVKLVRQGELEIVPPGFQPGKTLTPAQVTLKTLLKKRMDNLFEPEIVTKGLELAGKWKKLGTRPLAHISCDRGWLVLGWK